MAEVQKTTLSGELSQRFIEFVVMHAQNAALFLGQIPNPRTGEAEVNLDLARMFIDQLAMIQEKTRGNLTGEEAKVLSNALSNLQMAFVEASGGARPQRIVNQNAVCHLTFDIEEALVRDARNLAPSAVGLRIVFGEADPSSKRKVERIVFAITTFFPLYENH